MTPIRLIFLCVVGFTAVSCGGLSQLFESIGQQLSKAHDNGGTCDHEDRKNHAIDLLKEWLKHHHYDAIQKLYHDIYHKDLRRKRQWHHYQSNFDEAFTHGNTVPDYRHVEGYIWTTMNQGCRTQIMVWIEGLAHHHTHRPTQAPTTTHAPVTHAAHSTHQTHKPHTNAPTTQAATTSAPVTIAPLSIKTSCEAVTFVTALARGTILTNPMAGLCTDGTHSRPEALVLESCNAPTLSSWSKGVKVMGNCQNIPDYTPIATFSFGTFVQDGTGVAGIITECTSDGFKVAIQLCGHPVDVYTLKSGATDPKQNADNYYVINF